MKPLFKKPLSLYLLGVLALLIVSGAILSRLTDEYIILIAILGIEFIILSMMLLYVYNKYLKPISKAVETIEELVQGNYRARVRYQAQGMIADLNQNINQLARSLSELTIQEEMKTKQLLTVLNNTESGLALVDEKGYLHLVNRKFLSLFNKSKDDYIGYLYYDVIEDEKIQNTVQEAFLYEKNIKQSFTLPSDAGDRYIEVVSAPIFNERQMLKGAVIVLYDITELKQVAMMRKDFVANVSHELKTPITSIKGFAETLLDNKATNKETENHFLNIIYEESSRLQFLVEDLLTLSTLEKDDFQLKISNTNLSEIVADMWPMVKLQAEKKNITLNYFMEKDYILTADGEKLKQILINLVGNAISYTPDEGEVTLTIDEIDQFIRINVKDTGIGINQDDLPRLFERFYRVDKARSRNTGGTGLGLAIVKHIVEVHGGKINVESEINKGSSFTVCFPKELTFTN